MQPQAAAVRFEQCGLAAVFKQTVGALEVREDRGGQHGAARRATEFTERTGDCADVFRPGGVGTQIDTNADDQRADRAGLALDSGFGQNTASLRPFISTSLTHLICGAKPAVCSIPCATAIAAAIVTN